MAYSIKINRVGRCGTLQGCIARFTAETEVEALSIAAYEVDVDEVGLQRTATIFNAAGRLILAYAGHTGTNKLH